MKNQIVILIIIAIPMVLETLRKLYQVLNFNFLISLWISIALLFLMLYLFINLSISNSNYKKLIQSRIYKSPNKLYIKNNLFANVV